MLLVLGVSKRQTTRPPAADGTRLPAPRIPVGKLLPMPPCLDFGMQYRVQDIRISSLSFKSPLKPQRSLHGRIWRFRLTHLHGRIEGHAAGVLIIIIKEKSLVG